uniref:Uncharacterized protein n=1 Tax=Siphoviridae sp. ctXWf36 TaxID=2825544 RepID=A0A8S5U2W3_9CAUD|nr:MAG TPA: hypothetical protein [Siphoviridae sp. ctXWf36]
MIKVSEIYDDQHIRTVILYGKTADHKLYADEKYTFKVAADFIESAFKKGMLLVSDGTSMLRPAKFAAGKVVTVDGTTAVTGTEWSASEV